MIISIAPMYWIEHIECNCNCAVEIDISSSHITTVVQGIV